MYYEATGRFLDLAKDNHQRRKTWDIETMSTLQQLEPQATSFIMSSSAFFGAWVAGIYAPPDVVLEKWRPGKNPGWWTPNKRYSVGRKAAKVISDLPKMPDLAGEIMSALGYSNRYFSLPGGVVSSPGVTWSPLTGRLFVSWDERYPAVTDPDLVEVLHSTYHLACEEHDRLRAEQNARKGTAT